MNHVYYEFPPYALDIAQLVRSANWLIHSFELDNDQDAYNPAGYLYNAEYFGREYTIYLDLNIYQYVLSAFKKEKTNELHRNAIGLLVFGQFTNIIFDPTLAIYEKLNYSEECPDEITRDLELFRRIDNSEMDKLASFALGLTDEIILPEGKFVDHGLTKKELTRYRRLKKWDSIYLMVLEIVKLYYFDNCKNEEKIYKFLTWCHGNFGYSLVAIAFLISLVGKEQTPKQMKFKPDENVQKKKKALANMAWDLFLLDKFFEYWVNKLSNKEFLYASNDKPLKKTLALAISLQVHESCDHLTNMVSSFIVNKLNEIPILMKQDVGRKDFSIKNFQTYRNDLIMKNESILLNQH